MMREKNIESRTSLPTDFVRYYVKNRQRLRELAGYDFQKAVDNGQGTLGDNETKIMVDYQTKSLLTYENLISTANSIKDLTQTIISHEISIIRLQNAGSMADPSTKIANCAMENLLKEFMDKLQILINENLTVVNHGTQVYRFFDSKLSSLTKDSTAVTSAKFAGAKEPFTILSSNAVASDAQKLFIGQSIASELEKRLNAIRIHTQSIFDALKDITTTPYTMGSRFHTTYFYALNTVIALAESGRDLMLDQTTIASLMNKLNMVDILQLAKLDLPTMEGSITRHLSTSLAIDYELPCTPVLEVIHELFPVEFRAIMDEVKKDMKQKDEIETEIAEMDLKALCAIFNKPSEESIRCSSCNQECCSNAKFCSECGKFLVK